MARCVEVYKPRCKTSRGPGYRSDEPRIKTRPEREHYKFQYVHSLRVMAFTVYCFDPNHPLVGDAGTSRLGPATQTCPGAARVSTSRRPAAQCRRSLHSDATRTRRPEALHGEAGRPWVAQHERTYGSDDSGRAEGEEAVARATTFQAKTGPANRPTNYHHPPCCRHEGVLDRGRGRARRRDAPIYNKGVVLGGPTATRNGARART